VDDEDSKEIADDEDSEEVGTEKDQSVAASIAASGSRSPSEETSTAESRRNRFGHRRKYDKRQAIPTAFVNQLLEQQAKIEIEQTNPKRGKSAEVYDR
jgi:hypothetical protein